VPIAECVSTILKGIGVPTGPSTVCSGLYIRLSNLFGMNTNFPIFLVICASVSNIGMPFKTVLNVYP
jgi:hypothetical protein